MDVEHVDVAVGLEVRESGDALSDQRNPGVLARAN
jgi:hypothetical protein